MTATATRSGAQAFANAEIRIEGDAKVRGEAVYAADARREGMLWAAFVSSPLAHARITAVDTAAARAMPGVHAVLTGNDIGDHFLGRALLDWPVLATDLVRFTGQYVAAVAAETRAQAQAAAAAIDVTYAELPPIFDPEEAIAPGAPALHEHPERYPYIAGKQRPPVPHPNIQGYLAEAHGDVDAAFAQAHRVFEHRFATPRYFGGALEPRATLVWIDESGVVHVHSTNKAPFALRAQLAAATGVPAERIVVEPTYIGGDFGAKGFSVDEFACYFLARATGRPIKAVRTYLDDMRSTNVRHASNVTLKTAVAADGTILAMQGRCVFNGGAYAAAKPIPTILPAVHAIPALPYAIANERWEVLSVYTHTVPAGHVRSPGEIQLLFAIESQLDIIARELGIDPIALRVKNAGEPRMADVLERLRRETAWDRTPSRGAGRGRGISAFKRHVGGGATTIVVRPQAGGTIELDSAWADQGTGSLTAVQRVAGAALGIGLEAVRVVRRSTGEGPRDPGAGGSRTAHILGNATLDAIGKLTAALRGAGWNGTPETLPGALDALARSSAEPPSFTGSYDSNAAHVEANNYAAYCVDVAVDAETGVVDIERVTFVADTGTMLNPTAYRGQVDGGFMFGIGTATTEELLVEDGRIVNLSLADYKLPCMRDIPPFHVVLMDDEPGPGPFGAKAAGELNTGGVGPAVANAVADACNVRVAVLPVTAERVLAQLAQG